MRSVFVAVASLATMTTLAFATPFTVPANDSRWDILGLPPPARLERLHGIGCLPGADGLVVPHGARVEFIFQGTQLRLFGIPPPPATQILMDDAPLSNTDFEYLGGQAACVPFAEWPELAPRGRHNLTIVTPASNVPGEMAFLIANATGTAPDHDTPSPSSSSSTEPQTQSTLPTPSSPGSAQEHDSSPATPPQLNSSPRPALLIAAVLAPLSAFILLGFAAYFYVRHRRRSQLPGQTIRSASFKGMKETQFVIVTTSLRPDTPGGLGVVKV